MARRAREARARAARSTTRPSARLKGDALRAAFDGSPARDLASGIGARRRVRGVRRARSAGGSTTTRCSARCTTSTAAATGASGTRRCAIGDPRRARRPARGSPPAIRYYQYLQWMADEQWQQARADCGGVGVFGDFPFMVSGHSADVWARQHEFHLDASVGVPPDAGLGRRGRTGACRRTAGTSIAPGGLRMAARSATRRCAELFDAFRVDHLVGFYRTYVRERDGRAVFSPPDEPSQIAQGEALHGALPRTRRAHHRRGPRRRSGLRPRVARRGCGVPGLKVLRWERDWDTTGSRSAIRDGYPRLLGGDQRHARHRDDGRMVGRRRCERAPRRRRSRHSARPAGISRRAFSRAAPRRAARRAFTPAPTSCSLPIQDMFGWRERINTPSVVSRRQLDVAAALAGRGD